MSESFPSGWYQLATSGQIKKRKVYTFNYFGKSFVCYRDSKNSVNVFDAYCPHLGAHLGVGGKIVNDLLVCPFHGWKYNATGECVEIPYCKKIPKRAQLQGYQVQEINSHVYFHFDHGDLNSENKLDNPDSNLKILKKKSIKDFITTQMKNDELKKILEKAKAQFNFEPISAGLFMVKSKYSHLSLLLTATPVDNNEFSVSFSASTEKNFINLFRSCFIKYKAKKYFKALLNTAASV